MANVFDIFNVKPSQADVKTITPEVETVTLKDSNVTCQKSDKQTVVLEANSFENKHGGKLPGNDTIEDDPKSIKIDNAPSFVIPKLKRKGEDVLTEISIDSHEFQQELLPAVTKSFKCSSSHKRFTFHRARTIHNSDLSQSYLEKRRELKQAGYSDRDVADSYAFLYVEHETEVERICKEGVKIGNLPGSCLGDPQMGVQLSKHADVLRPSSYPVRFTGQLLIFKIIKGHVKAVFENRNLPYLEPTPNHDCHVSKSSTADLNTGNPLQLFESSQVYLYEYGDLTVEDFPRHICPFAVLSFVYKTEVRPPKPLEIPSLSPKLPSPVNSYTPGSKSMVSPGLKPMMSPSSKSTVSPGGKNMLSPGGKNMLSPGSRETSSMDEEYTTWSGRLSVKGLFSCQVEMFSTASCIKPVKIGSTLNVTKKCSLPLAQSKYFGQLSSLRKNGEVYWRSNYINVCELRPKSDSQVQFQKVRNYLGKHNSMAVLNPDVDTVLLLMPDCSLTYTLGLTKPHQYRLVLHCIFLSKQSCKFKSPRYAMNQSRQSQNNCSNTSCLTRSPMSPPTHFSTPLHVNINNNNQPQPCSPSLFTPPPNIPLVSDPWSNTSTVSPKFFPQFHPSIPPPLPPLPPPPPPPPPPDQSPLCPVGSPVKSGVLHMSKSSSQSQLVTYNEGLSPTASSGNCSPLSPLSRSIVAARREAGPAARLGPISDAKLLYPKQSSHQDPKLFHRSISSPEMHDPPRPLRLTSLPSHSLHLGFDEGFVHKVPSHCLLNTGNVQELFDSQHQSRFVKSKSKTKNRHLLTECEQDSTISSTCAEDEANLDRGRRPRSDSVQSSSDMEMTESQLEAIVKNYVPSDSKYVALQNDSSCSPLKSPQRVDFVASAEDMRTFLENNLKRSTVVNKPERSLLEKANEKFSPIPVKTVEDSPAVTSTDGCKGEDQSHLSTANDMKQFLNSTLSKPVKRPSPRKDMKKGFNGKDKMIKLTDERHLRPILQKIKRYKMKSWLKNFRSPTTVITVLPTFIREIDMKYMKKCPKKKSSSPVNETPPPANSAVTSSPSQTPPPTSLATSSSSESPQASTPSSSTSQHTPKNKDSPVIQSSPGFLALSRRNSDWATQGLSPLTLFSPPRCVSVSGEATQVNIVNTYHQVPSAPQGGKMAAIHYHLHGLSGNGNVSTSLTESVTAVLHMEEEEEDIRYVKKADSEERCDDESSEECIPTTPDLVREECSETTGTAIRESAPMRPESPLEQRHTSEKVRKQGESSGALTGDCAGKNHTKENADVGSGDHCAPNIPEDNVKKSTGSSSSHPHEKQYDKVSECETTIEERLSKTENTCDYHDNRQTDIYENKCQPESSEAKEQAAASPGYQPIPVLLGTSADRVLHCSQEFQETSAVTGSNNIAIEPVPMGQQRRSWIVADDIEKDNDRSENKSKSTDKSRSRSKSGCSSELRSRSSSSQRSKKESRESNSESKSNKSKENDSKSEYKDRRESRHHRSKSDSHRLISGDSRHSSRDHSKSRTEGRQSSRSDEQKASKTVEQQTRKDEKQQDRDSKKDKHHRSYSRDSRKDQSRARTSPEKDKTQDKNRSDNKSRESSRSRHSSKSSTKSDAEPAKSLDKQLKAVFKIADSLSKDRHAAKKSQNQEASERSCDKKEKNKTEVPAPDKGDKSEKVTSKLSQMTKIADKVSKVEKQNQVTSGKFGNSKADSKAKEKIKKHADKMKQSLGFKTTSFPQIPGLYTEEMVAGISRGESLNTSSIKSSTSQLRDTRSESQNPSSGAVRNLTSSLNSESSSKINVGRDRPSGEKSTVQERCKVSVTECSPGNVEERSQQLRSVVSRLSDEKMVGDHGTSLQTANETRSGPRSGSRIQRRVEFMSDNQGNRNSERTVEFQGTQSGQPVRNLNTDQISEDRHSRQFHPYRNSRRQKPMANFNIGVQNLDELLADLTASSLKERRLEEHWSFGLHHNFRQRSRFSNYRFIRNPVLPSPDKNRPSQQDPERYEFTPDNIPEFETRSHQADMLDDFFMGEQSKEPELAAAFDIEKATYTTEVDASETASASNGLGAIESNSRGNPLLRTHHNDLNLYEDKENIGTVTSHHSPQEDGIRPSQDIHSNVFFDQIGWSFSSNRIKTKENFNLNTSTFALDASISNDGFRKDQTPIEESPQREIQASSKTPSCPVDPRLSGSRMSHPTEATSHREASSDLAMFQPESSPVAAPEENLFQQFEPPVISEEEETIPYGANGFPEMIGTLSDEGLSRESIVEVHDDLRVMAMDLDENNLNEQNHEEGCQKQRPLQESIPVETRCQDQMVQATERSSPKDSFRFFSELWSSSTGVELSGLDKTTSGKSNPNNANSTPDPSLNKAELQERKSDAAKMLEELNSYLNVDEAKMSGRNPSPAEEPKPKGNTGIVIDKKISSFLGCIDSAVTADNGNPLQQKKPSLHRSLSEGSSGVSGHSAYQESRQPHRPDSFKRQYSSEEHQVPVSDASNSSRESDPRSKEGRTKTENPRSNSEELKVRKKRHHRRPTGPHPDQFNHWEHVVFPFEVDPWRDFKYERNPQLGSYHVLELHDCPSADPRRNKEILQKRDKEMLHQHTTPSTLSTATKIPPKKAQLPNSMLERELFAPTLAEQITCASQERRKQLLAGSGTRTRKTSEHKETDLKTNSKEKEPSKVGMQCSGDSHSTTHSSRQEKSSYPKPLKLDDIPTAAASVDQHVKNMLEKQLSRKISDINPIVKSKADDTDKTESSTSKDHVVNHDYSVSEKGDACSMESNEACLEDNKISTETEKIQLNKRKHSCSSSDTVHKVAKLDNDGEIDQDSLHDYAMPLEGVTGQDVGSLDKQAMDDLPVSKSSRSIPTEVSFVHQASEMTNVDIVSIKQFDSNKQEPKSSQPESSGRVESLNDSREEGEITNSEDEVQVQQLRASSKPSSLAHKKHGVSPLARSCVDSNQEIKDGSAIHPIILTSSDDENQPLERSLKSITDNVTAIEGKVMKDLESVASRYISRDEMSNDKENSRLYSRQRSPEFPDGKHSIAREYKLSTAESQITKSLDSKLEEFCSQVMPLVENVMNQIQVVEDQTESVNESSMTKETAMTNEKSLSHENIEGKENQPIVKLENISLTTQNIVAAELSRPTSVQSIPVLTSQASIINSSEPPEMYPQACYPYSSIPQELTSPQNSAPPAPDTASESQTNKGHTSDEKAAPHNRVYFNPRMMHMWPQIHQSYYPPFPPYPPQAYSQPIGSDAQGLPYPVSSLTNSAGLPWNMNTPLGINLSPYQYAPQYPFYPMVAPPPPRPILPSPTVSPATVDPPLVTVEQIALMQQQRVAQVFDESVSQIATIAEDVCESIVPTEDGKVSGGDGSESHPHLEKNTSRHEENSNEIMKGVFATCDNLLADIMEQDSQASSSTSSDLPSSTSVPDIVRDTQRESVATQDMELANDDSMVSSSIDLDVDVCNFSKEVREHINRCVQDLRSSPSRAKTRENSGSLVPGLVELSSTCYDYCDSVSVPERLQESLIQGERRVLNQFNQVQRQVYETPPSSSRHGSQGGVVNAEDRFFLKGDPDHLATVLLYMYDQCRAGMKWQLLVHSSIVVELAKKRDQEDISAETDTHRKLSIISAYRKRGIVRLLSTCDCDRYMRSSYSLGICVAKFRQKEFPLLKQSFMLSEDAADYSEVPDGTRKVVYLPPKMFIEKYLMPHQAT